MWGSWWWGLLLGAAAGLLLAWAALIAVLVIARPRGGLLREALRLLPDLLRLLPRLAADRSLPSRVRAGLVLLLAYLAFPFDLVPDFIPVLGYADDAIIVAAVLRWGFAPGRYRGDPPPVAGKRRGLHRSVPRHRPDLI